MAAVLNAPAANVATDQRSTQTMAGSGDCGPCCVQWARNLSWSIPRLESGGPTGQMRLEQLARLTERAGALDYCPLHAPVHPYLPVVD